MQGLPQREYTIAACFDTETSTIGEGVHSHAFTISYQVNDLRGIRLRDYTPGQDDRVHIYRNEREMLAFLEQLIEWGDNLNLIPVVCAYNLRFDIQTLLESLAVTHPLMRVQAQTSRTLYTLDLMRDEQPILRFWDTYHLNKTGLASMGLLAGLPKATGDWDYTLTRTPETPLTAQEEHYATRDVQVIPAYLRYILNANPWIDEKELGYTVLTSTSLVRRFARANIGTLHDLGGKTLWECWLIRCKTELPKTYESYATRRACFRGGLSFTAAKMAGIPVRNVASLDVTSMHHTFMARAIPVNFHPCNLTMLQTFAEYVVRLPVEDILVSYVRPFPVAFHARIAFTNLRFKDGSCFQHWDIGTLSESKFGTRVERYSDTGGRDAADEEQSNAELADGFHDTATRPVYAFGKLVAAQSCELYLNEIELYITSLVYDWDTMTVLGGELSVNWRKCPDYIALQSRMLYRQKAQIKKLIHDYRNEPYGGDIGDTIPPTIAAAARAGSVTSDELNAYYYHCKTMFNAIYGTCAQNEFKPGFKMRNGEVTVDTDTVTTDSNFKLRRPKKSKVLYTYGMRIVAGSRLHLVLGMKLLWDALGRRIDVLGGDTDSLKIRCDPEVTDDEIMHALAPLHAAADQCIRLGYTRTRREFAGQYPVDMPDVGHFDIETCGHDAAGHRVTRYPWHIELWNKCRVSITNAGGAKVTAAGLARPVGTYTIVDWYEDAVKKHGAKWALRHGLGYSTIVSSDLCHMLQRTSPLATDTVEADVTDYTGRTCHISQHEAIALYDTGKLVGDTFNRVNGETLIYLELHYGRTPRTDPHYLTANDWRQQ